MAIDTDEAQDNLFGDFKKKSKKSKKEPEGTPVDKYVQYGLALKDEKASKAKWQDFEKVTALLSYEQKEQLDKIAKQAMKYRSKLPATKERERITTNTVLRALIESFLERAQDLDEEVINDERDAKEWIAKLFR